MDQTVKMKSTQPVDENATGAIVMPFDTSEEQQQKIATAAYYKAQARGFEPGYELEDWLAAEAELDGSV